MNVKIIVQNIEIMKHRRFYYITYTLFESLKNSNALRLYNVATNGVLLPTSIMCVQYIYVILYFIVCRYLKCI